MLTAMSVSNARIVLHFDVHQPIELVELTLSFGSLARQYRSFLTEKARQVDKKVHDADVKLFITKIENNCILAELAGATDILGSLFTVIEYTNTFVDFVKNINETMSYFRGLITTSKIDPSKIPYSKRQCEDFANFLKVVSDNKGGNLGISVAEYAKANEEAKVYAKFTYTSEQAFEAQKGALLAQRALDEKGAADYNNVLMYFYQTNIEDSKAQGKTGEKAIIKGIHPKELPVFFVSQLDQDRIRGMKNDPKANPFKSSYRVDVNVETDRNDMPKFYRVLRVHEIIPDEQ